MEVIPAINCTERACIKEKLDEARKFLKAGHWIHLDIADARFTFNRTWGSPTEWASLNPEFNLEVHLMVEEPHKAVGDWIAAGAKRIIVHAETLTAPDILEAIRAACAARKVEVMLAASPETSVQELVSRAAKVSAFQILAVHPGLAGQKFYPLMIDKIKLLRARLSTAKIEVDGGVNFETARLARDAGADIAVSASYIFDSPDPAAAYNKLKQL